MMRKRALGRWETKPALYKVTSQAIWPTAKSLPKRGRPKAQSAIRGPLGPIFYPMDKTNIFADCLENLFRLYA
jgi:hypothetical protein